MHTWNTLKRNRIGAAIFLLLALHPAQASSDPKPSPTLDPAEVVRAQLDALAHNDTPKTDAGIAVVFGFSSPGNRSQTGPLPRFAQMLHKGFPEMLNHRSVSLQPTYIKGDAAMQGVELVDAKGDTHRYIFVLSRQVDAPYKGCWMTDSVLTSPDDKPGQAL